MSAITLHLPASQRSKPQFKEQRRQKLEEYLAKRKAISGLKLQEKQITSNSNCNRKTSGDPIQKVPKALKLTSTKMDDKENANRPIWRKIVPTVERNGAPLKSTNLLTNSTIDIDACYRENCDQIIQVPSNEDDPKIRNISLSQTFRLQRNTKEKQLIAEKLKQDTTFLKKPVLGSYRGRVVQSKVNSFRKPSTVTDESSMISKKTSATVLKTRPQSVSSTNLPVKGSQITSVSVSTKSNSTTTSQNKTAFQHSGKKQVDFIQNKEKEAIVRNSTNVTIRREPNKKIVPLSKPVLPNVKTNLNSGKKENEVQSKCRTSGAATTHVSEAKPASSFSTRFREDSKIVDKRRYTLTKAPISTGRTALTKESAEERRARLVEWQNDKRRVIKRSSTTGLTVPPAPPAPSNIELPKEKPLESFWTTIAEEDEQRLFTDKVNKIFSEYLNLINKGCPREEVLLTLKELIVKIPDAKKLVKYWVCLARLEPITSPIENIIAIYEEAILAGAQPMEEMRHALADILTMKSQVKGNDGENVDEVCSANEEIKKLCDEVLNQDKVDVDEASAEENSESKDKDHNTKNVKLQMVEREQEDKAEDSTSVLETPDKETSGSYVIKYNVSTTPYLQSVKKKMNFDENSASFKDLKFLTPVRRSRRLQEKFCKLPDMLKDHYPCVSSLEQLAELGSESSAYICRPNTALCTTSLEEEIKQTEMKL
ncbi:cytoskeleton-associated protein 2 isoform X1 [Monodelphis domestica]|uniref:cytoskeleton-associated protein 2 isoform X1 n=1 Tax=Monodelphis domestica TaxID=13616 RepID=UPI0000F2D048|nr:cytoskeleton-associated protein 2 isoform X1 [Monodelphis domestica]